MSDKIRRQAKQCCVHRTKLIESLRAKRQQLQEAKTAIAWGLVKLDLSKPIDPKDPVVIEWMSKLVSVLKWDEEWSEG